MALTGRELVQITGVLSNGAPAATNEQTTTQAIANLGSAGGLITHAPTFTVNGGGSTISTGLKGMILIPYACTITSVNIVCDQSNSSIVFDIWKVAQGSAPATITNSITASDQPTVSNAYEAHDSTLTGWTKSIAANSYLYFNVNSASNATIAVITLTATGTT